MKKIFPFYSLSKLDYLIGGALLAVCYVSFFHGDIFGAGWDSLNYLFGRPLEFYENCKKIRGGGENMLGTPYPPTIYAIFALWLYPFKLWGVLTSPAVFPTLLVYWLKALTTLVYAASGVVFYKIVLIYSGDKPWAKYATAIWLTTPLAMFSQFIFSQYDIFYVFFMLVGFLMFLRGRLSMAALFFGVAITFKYFPIFVFIPLLLLYEKRMFKLLMYFFIFSLPTLLIQCLYGQSAAFTEGVIHHFALARVYAASMDIGGWSIYPLAVFFTILCGGTYLSEISKERLPRSAAYVFLVASVFPFLFIVWHPQWAMFFSPAIVLTTLLDKRCDKFLTLDLAGMFCFIATISIAYQGNVDTRMFRGEVHAGLYSMADFFRFFKEHSLNVFLSLFWGYLAIQIASKFRLVMRLSEQEKSSINYGNVRYRFYVGLFIFVVPAMLSIFWAR